jgi:hypothetical protein
VYRDRASRRMHKIALVLKQTTFADTSTIQPFSPPKVWSMRDICILVRPWCHKSNTICRVLFPSLLPVDAEVGMCKMLNVHVIVTISKKSD